MAIGSGRAGSGRVRVSLTRQNSGYGSGRVSPGRVSGQQLPPFIGSRVGSGQFRSGFGSAVAAIYQVTGRVGSGRVGFSGQQDIF